MPDGTTRRLLSIKRWDFHWQQEYRYQKPIALPRGTTLTMKYTYDNSADNHHNPHKPPKPVVYGPNSSDEMGDLWVQVLPRSSADAATLVRAFAEREARANVAGAELLVRRVPEDAKNQTFLGSSYVESGRFAEAIPPLEHALRLDPRSANAHNQLGGALVSLGRVREAIPHLRQAAALAPDDERMQFNLGYALNAAGLPADAAQAFRRAIAINPDFAEAHDNLGVFLISRNQLAEALVHLRKAVALAPNSADAHSNLGGALVNAGKLDEGLQHIRRALELRPDHEVARQNLAILERRSGRDRGSGIGDRGSGIGDRDGDGVGPLHPSTRAMFTPDQPNHRNQANNRKLEARAQLARRLRVQLEASCAAESVYETPDETISS